MIIGMGIDFVSVSRITHWLEDETLCRRFFHPEELRYIHSCGVQAAWSLAARFAAKEAFVKALGSGFAGIVLKDIRVKNERSGRPQLIPEGSAFDAMVGIGARWAHVSLTHEGDLAAAQVILEG